MSSILGYYDVYKKLNSSKCAFYALLTRSAASHWDASKVKITEAQITQGQLMDWCKSCWLNDLVEDHVMFGACILTTSTKGAIVKGSTVVQCLS